MNTHSIKKPKISALRHACFLLNRREYSHKELLENLTRKGHEAEEVEKALAQLQEMGIQSDERTAKMLWSVGKSRKYGPKRISMMAKQKGVSEEDMQQTQPDEDDESWLEQATQLATKRFGPAPYDREIKIKVARLLMGRGHTSDVAWKVAGSSGEELMEDGQGWD